MVLDVRDRIVDRSRLADADVFAVGVSKLAEDLADSILDVEEPHPPSSEASLGIAVDDLSRCCVLLGEVPEVDGLNDVSLDATGDVRGEVFNKLMRTVAQHRDLEPRTLGEQFMNVTSDPVEQALGAIVGHRAIADRVIVAYEPPTEARAVSVGLDVFRCR
jgi:hypothetical protein